MTESLWEILLIPLSWGGAALSTSKVLIVVLNVIGNMSMCAEVFRDTVDLYLQFLLSTLKKMVEEMKS